MAGSWLQLALGPGSHLNWAMRLEGGKRGVPAFNLPEKVGVGLGREWTGTGSRVGRLSSSMVDKAPHGHPWQLLTAGNCPRRGREGTCLFHKLGEMKTLFKRWEKSSVSLGNWVCLLPTKPSHCKAAQLRAQTNKQQKSSVSSCESPGRRTRDQVSEEMAPPPPSSWDTGAAGLGQELARAPSKGVRILGFAVLCILVVTFAFWPWAASQQHYDEHFSQAGRLSAALESRS